MDAPVVSVVMPMLNAAGTVRAAVSSVLAAGARLGGKVEVVVVDDGSSDGSEGVVGALGDPRVRVFTVQERAAAGDSARGPGAARNFGLERVRGAYVLCVDSDDVVEPDGPARLLARAEAAGRAGKARAACGAVRLGGETLAPLGRTMTPPGTGVDRAALEAGSVMTTGAAVLMEASAATRVRIDGGLRVSEDWDWWRRLAEGGVVWASVGGPAVCTYRVREGSVTKDWARIARDTVLAAERAVARGVADEGHVASVRRRCGLEAASRAVLGGRGAEEAAGLAREIAGGSARWTVGEAASAGAWGVVLGQGRDPGDIRRAGEDWSRLRGLWRELARAAMLDGGDEASWGEVYAGEAASRRSIARRLLERAWALGGALGGAATLVGLGRNVHTIVDEAGVLGMELWGADESAEVSAGWSVRLGVRSVGEAANSAEAVIVTPTNPGEGLRTIMAGRAGTTLWWSEAWAEERRRLATVLRGG